MPERVRSFISYVTDIVRHRASATRHQVSFPLCISLGEAKSPGRADHRPRASWGVTHDISKTGISFVVPSVTVGGRHLFSPGGSDTLIEVELPGGRVQARAVPVRYELLTGDEPGTRYLIAARIVEMDDADRALVKQCLIRARGGAAKHLGLTAESGRAAAQGT